MILSILVAVLVPLVFLYVVWALEIYAISQMRLLLGGIIWGVVAFGLALLIQTQLFRAGQSYDRVTLLVAPVLEELLKAALIFALASRMRLRYAVDGATYGFAIGTGFAMAENLLYFTLNPGIALGQTIARVLSASLMHAFNTAIVGAQAGNNVQRSARQQVTHNGLTLLLVIILHALYNQIAAYAEGGLLIVLGILFGIAGTAALMVLIGRALKSTSQTISRELSDNLTSGEVAAVLHPDRIADLLADHRGSIDPARAERIQQYIALQAQRGILRKSIVMNTRSRYAGELHHQLTAVEQQLTRLRGELGVYTWAWMRSVLPSDESDLWVRLGGELGADNPTLDLMMILGKRVEQVSPAERADRMHLLHKVGLFHHLAAEELEDLALLLQEQRFSVGDEILRQGVANDLLYCLATGSVIASVMGDDGTETILTAYETGGVFGELSMIDGHPVSATVSCASDVKVFTLSRADFLTLVYANPGVGVEMMRQLVGEIRRQTALVAWIRQNG
ncbi:MAG: PrsW family glutamic-type intramembrane protease [Chloroflexota bacterium]